MSRQLLPARRSAGRRTAVLVAAVLLVSSAVTLGWSGGTASAAGVGTVHGAVVTPGGYRPALRLMWFTQDWHYLGSRRLSGGLYSLRLAPGRYRLQVVDLRPTWDVHKYAPADASVVVSAGRTAVRNVRMHTGAAITGTVVTGSGLGRHARVVAARTDQRSFATVANGKGQFAIGGLPRGSYSVFTYDRSHRWVARSTWVPHLRAGHPVNTVIRLRTRAGQLLVDIFGGNQPIHGSTVVTAVSRRSGQFWTTRTRQGSAVFPSVYPGRYTVYVNGVDVYLPAHGAVARADVRPGQAAFGSFRLVRTGARITGQVVDAIAPKYPLKGAAVLLFDRFGTKLDSTRTDAKGVFWLGGQLTTQSGLTVVVNPNPDSGGWMQAAAYCRYNPATVSGISVRTGAVEAIDPVLLPHQVDASTPAACKPPAPGGGTGGSTGTGGNR